MSKPRTASEWEFLRRVMVRLIRPEERERFDALLEQEHYLHSARLGGQSLRYVAEVDGQWVAHPFRIILTSRSYSYST